LVLEVNAVPGWREISKVLDVDLASMILREIERLRSVRRIPGRTEPTLF